MAKHEVAPPMIAEALALRAAGYTALAISQRLGVSIRTLQRHFASSKTAKGVIKTELLDRAKADMLASVTMESSIKEAAARLVADDFAHSLHIREVILAASEFLKATNTAEAALVMRAAAAYSTTLKNTSDVIRHNLRAERFSEDVLSELPELVVRELSAEEIAELRDVAAKHDVEDGADATLDEVVDESM
jgi:AraC-like DNA-binding protein